MQPATSSGRSPISLIGARPSQLGLKSGARRLLPPPKAPAGLAPVRIVDSSRAAFNFLTGPGPKKVKDLAEEINKAQDITYSQRVFNIAQVAKKEQLLEEVEIDAIKLDIMNPKDLDKMAVVTCVDPRIEGHRTVNDPLMGTLEELKLCASCNQTSLTCPGHYGQINLWKSIINPLFNSYVLLILKSVCFTCGEILLLDSSDKEGAITLESLNAFAYSGITRLKLIAENSENAICRKGHRKNPTFNFKRAINTKRFRKRDEEEDAFAGYFTRKTKGKESEDEESSKKSRIEDEEIIQLLRKITPEDAVRLGFESGTELDRFVLSKLTVMPPTARPYGFVDQEKIQSGLTVAYTEIIQRNNDLTEQNLPPELRQQRGDKLKLLIGAFCNNNSNQYEIITDTDGPFEGINQLLKGKEGYIRGNMMGKRVSFVGRTVAGPGGHLRFGEVGMSDWMRTISLNEVVTVQNLDSMTELYKSGKILNLTPARGELKDTRTKVDTLLRREYLPQPGDRIERLLRDGDLTLMGRQPSLHKQSLMGYRIRFNLPNEYNAQIHMSVTSPLNADFDGDEVNFHVIQTYEARVEAGTIAFVGSNMMNAPKNRPAIGIVYNGITSAYLLTQTDLVLSEEDWQEGFSVITDPQDLDTYEERLAEMKVDPRSGFALISTIFPADFYYTKEVEKDKVTYQTVIRKGILLQTSPLIKPFIGVDGNTILQSIWKQYGQWRAMQFLTDFTFLLNWFIEKRGFSVGYKDIVPKDNKEIRETIDKSRVAVELKIEGIPPIAPESSELEKEYREKTIRAFLDSASNEINKNSVKVLPPDNALKIMSTSGAKGDSFNTSQLTGLLGEQYINGLRPEPTLSEGTRTLPYFDFGSESLEAHGYVENSFVTGLNPAEFIFHQSASRIGLLDTALKTGETGYLFKKVVKILEDMKIGYDGSVRNANNVIFQFAFADGFDSGELLKTGTGRGEPITTFINLRETVGKINSSLGYPDPALKEYIKTRQK